MAHPVTTPQFRGLSSRSRDASRAKAGNTSSGTRPEALLRKLVWRSGVRYRCNCKSLPGKPDMVFVRARIVVFVDGDFWHGNDWGHRRLALARGHNSDYWVRKIEYNMARDQRVSARLHADGWTVVRVWESTVLQDPEGTADAITALVRDAARR